MSNLYIFDENDYKKLFLNNEDPTRVESIQIIWSELDALPSEINKFINLRNLSIFLTNTKIISEEIGSLQKLEELSIFCKISKIPESIGEISSLKKLVISGDFKVVPDSIFKLQNLEIFNLWGSEFNFLPNKIHNLISLKEMAISGENLLELPEDFGLLENLKSFLISAKKLKALPKSFCNLNKIEYLNFVYDPMNWFECSIENIPNYFKEFTELRTFRINSIKNQSVSNFIQYWPKLEVLEISNCELNSFPIETRCVRILR